MSIQKRKISYWSVDFETNEGRHYFDEDIFKRFMSYLVGLDEKSLLFRDEKNNKAISIESIRDEVKQGIHLIKCAFKSCKYNHSPDYMSSIDGSERPTDKLLYEGEKELTHICFRIEACEAYTIFEERRNGVAMGMAVHYFNKFLKQFNCDEGIDDEYYIQASIIPPDDFITGLGKTSRISSAELFIENKVLGSGYLNLMDMDANSQESLTICIKAKPRTSLAKRSIEGVFRSITTGGTEVNRIRIRGKDVNKMNITLDSLNGKKVDEISVVLTENGVVDSYSIFSKLEELLGVTE